MCGAAGSAADRAQRGHARVRAGEVVLPGRAHELFAGPGQGAAGEVVGHHVVAQHVDGRYPQLRGQEAGEAAGIRVADRPDGHHVLLGVELQAVRAQRGVQVDRELRDAQDGPVHPHQPHLETAGRAHHHPAGQPQVAVQPRIEQRAAVDLDAELPETGPAGIRAGLDPQRRAVGMRAEQPEAGVRRRALRDDPGEQGTAVGHHVAARTGWPGLRLSHFGEAGRGQPAQRLGGGVIRRRRRVDEADEVERGVPGTGHRPILARSRTASIRGAAGPPGQAVPGWAGDQGAAAAQQDRLGEGSRRHRSCPPVVEYVAAILPAANRMARRRAGDAPVTGPSSTRTPGVFPRQPAPP